MEKYTWTVNLWLAQDLDGRISCSLSYKKGPLAIPIKFTSERDLLPERALGEVALLMEEYLESYRSAFLSEIRSEDRTSLQEGESTMRRLPEWWS